MPEVQELYELENGNLGGVIGYYARGHHSDAKFLEALRDYLDDATLEYDRTPRRVYYRNVPQRDGMVMYTEIYQRGRGAYPVTILDV